MQELSGGRALGALKGLSSEEATAHSNELVSRFVRTLTTALAQGIEDDLAPALRTMTNDTIDAALDGAASPAHRQKLDQLTGILVSSVMRSAACEIPSSIGPAMHEAMLDELGPALREILRKDIAPGMADALTSPAFKAALGETSREVAYRAVLGSNEALAELAERQDREGGSPLGAFFAGRTWLLVAIVAAVVLAVPLVWLLRDRRLARRYREDMERRNARAMALLGAMQSAPEGAWSTHVLALLREQLLDETKPGREAERPSPPRSSRPHRPRHA